MSNKKKVQLVASRVEALISELHNISSDHLEADPEAQSQRMAEIYAAVSFISGEMAAYLLFMGMREEDIDKVGEYYQDEGKGKLMSALGAVAVSASNGQLD